MNTPSNLDIVLNKLYAAAKNTVGSEIQNFTITCDSEGPEYLEEYLEAVEFLKKGKVIESYKISSQGEEDIEIEYGEYDTERVTLCFLKLNCRLKPETLISFMVETSRLPKYSLKINQQRQLILNDLYILSTPQFNSPNRYFIEYALEHPGETIKKTDVEKKAGVINKRFHTILEQIIKSPDLRQVFFPDVSKDAAKFRNKVMTNDLVGENINEQKIAVFLKTLQKIVRR